jgi:hypothetical protein
VCCVLATHCVAHTLCVRGAVQTAGLADRHRHRYRWTGTGTGTGTGSGSGSGAGRSVGGAVLRVSAACLTRMREREAWRGCGDGVPGRGVVCGCESLLSVYDAVRVARQSACQWRATSCGDDRCVVSSSVFVDLCASSLALVWAVVCACARLVCGVSVVRLSLSRSEVSL